jgi:hypothetical protein
MKTHLAIALLLVGLGAAGTARAEDVARNFAGSIQLDQLVVPTTKVARQQALDGATVEVSLKMALDFSANLSANVKVCYSCHGFEMGMAYFDIRVADQLNFRVGRFSPAFGEFPLRHDPANHRTSDKPLPYDMGRMLRLREWNMGVLPAPWVDNGLEISGTQFIGGASRLDYALYAVSGPKGPVDGFDFDFAQSRSAAAYYADNNSRPTVGARLAATVALGDSGAAISAGGSGMAGSYDPQNRLRFVLLGADLLLRVRGLFLRAEYLVRRTEMALGSDPASRFRYGPGPDGTFDNFFLKEGWYVEAEVPVGHFDLVARWDGLRRRGNVPQQSSLRSESIVARSTAAFCFRLAESLRLKASVEYYDFSDFDDEIALHFGLAGTL